MAYLLCQVIFPRSPTIVYTIESFIIRRLSFNEYSSYMSVQLQKEAANVPRPIINVWMFNIELK